MGKANKIVASVFLMVLCACQVGIKDSSDESSSASTATLTANSNAVTLDESGSGSVTFNLSKALDKQATFTWTISANPDSPTSDFTTLTGTATITAGATSTTINLPIVNDSTHESSKTFKLVVSAPSSNLKVTSTIEVTITLTDDDPATLLVSNTSLYANSAFSFVDLDVDWSRKIAYVSSRWTGVCVNAIDFSNPLVPVVRKTIGSATTPATTGNTCLGVTLFDNGTKMVVGSQGSNTLEVWDLGADPTQYNWSQLSTRAVSAVKRSRVKSLGGSDWQIVTARGTGVDNVVWNSSTGFTATSSYSLACTGGMNDTGIFGSTMIYACSDTGSDIKTINLADGSLNTSISMGAPSDGAWSVAVSDDETKAFVGGWTSAFLQNASGTFTSTFRFDNQAVYRGADFESIDGKDLFFAISGPDGSSVRQLDVFDASNISSINLLSHSAIPVSGDGYMVRANSSARQIIVVSNRGDFVILNYDGLTAATSQFTGY